jgi:hypothetical protein
VRALIATQPVHAGRQPLEGEQLASKSFQRAHRSTDPATQWAAIQMGKFALRVHADTTFENTLKIACDLSIV